MRSTYFVTSLAGIALGAFAIALPTAHAGGDAAAGKAITAACQACHLGVDPRGETPQLTAQRETYLAKQLKAFKSGDRKNPLMNAMASQLSDADIANLAAYWSQTSSTDTAVPDDIAAIKKSKMAFPRDFPKGFVLYATTNKEEQASVVKAYVNTVGFEAVKANKPLPDGSVIMIAAYNAKLDANKKPVVDKDGSWVVDKVKAFEGMEARAGWGKDVPEMLRNVNWNYSLFNADKTPRTEVNQALCLACHKPQADNSFVFGLKKIQAKAGIK
jgi:cytochrome c553